MSFDSKSVRILIDGLSVILGPDDLSKSDDTEKEKIKSLDIKLNQVKKILASKKNLTGFVIVIFTA